MGDVSMLFTRLVAEAIGLLSTAFDHFFDEAQQHKLKIVKYPDRAELGVDGEEEAQGVGPHKDSMLTSYLLQATDHRGLQVQNTLGEWIDCTPIAGTLVVAIGQGLEALTQGVCASTTHRVLSPAKGTGARYSIPFFQGVSYDATFESMQMPEEVMRLRQEVLRRNGARKDDIEFTFSKGRWNHLGEATLMNRIRSHPDVGERWVCWHWRSSDPPGWCVGFVGLMIRSIQSSSGRFVSSRPLMRQRLLIRIKRGRGCSGRRR